MTDDYTLAGKSILTSLPGSADYLTTYINLQEAAQLARLTASRLGCTLEQARSTRTEILKIHLRMHGSQNTLRVRVKEIFDETVKVSTA